MLCSASHSPRRSDLHCNRGRSVRYAPFEGVDRGRGRRERADGDTNWRFSSSVSLQAGRQQSIGEARGTGIRVVLQ